MDSNDFMEGMKISRKKHDMIAIRLFDEAETKLPNLGIVQLFNAESNETTWVNTNSFPATISSILEPSTSLLVFIENLFWK